MEMVLRFDIAHFVMVMAIVNLRLCRTNLQFYKRGRPAQCTVHCALCTVTVV
jgi:hypothetical protein